MSLPAIAYLIMSFDYVDTVRGIIQAIKQPYEGKKVVYLMYQEPYPPPIELDLPERLDVIEVREFNVPGTWPRLWMAKMLTFLRNCKEPYMLQWDEDDDWENEYTARALKPLLNGKAKISWNHHNVDVMYGLMKQGLYGSPVGTLAAEVATLAPIVEKLAKSVENHQVVKAEKKSRGSSNPINALLVSKKRRRRAKQLLVSGKVPYGGAKDAALWRLIKKKFAHIVAEHDGWRFYTRHSQTNTCIKSRPPSQAIDFQPKVILTGDRTKKGLDDL